MVIASMTMVNFQRDRGDAMAADETGAGPDQRAGVKAASGPLMQDASRFLDKIAAQRAQLSPSERKVADFVLDHPERIIRMSIAELAASVGVSQPTVLRFVRSLGLSRYPDLKLLTGQSIVSGTPYLHSEVRTQDTLDEVTDKIFDSSIHVLNTVRQSINREALMRAVQMIVAARRIDCFGAGAASILAIEAQHKLMRLGLPVMAYVDTHLQRMAAATLGPRDVVLCFSHTGEIRDTVKMAMKAREVGACVIALTKPGTALAAAADILLAIDAHENTEVYAPMTSRIAHAVVLDIIVTAVALHFGEPLLKRLRDVKDSLADLRLPAAHGQAGKQGGTGKAPAGGHGG
ncbi:MAG: SIS domain-containing protein [Chelatococcus sp.]|uniref:SIS domain-containing protein n=1 Tax=Chelatococcus sp. TaxID=1953771 RepID=UPI0025BFA5B7|nr:SIS domain-containing protein [Chelatococcus sp.]MBX3537185.1 SIS domain-containing protein [Chelatococcus sp.]